MSEPMDLITGCTSFSSNTFPTFHGVADQMCRTSMNFGSFALTKLLQLSKIPGMSGVNSSL